MKFQFRTLCAALCAIMGIAVCTGGVSAALPHISASAAPEMVYKLDFSDSEDYGKNTSGSSVGSATLTGSATYTENAIHGKTAINLPGGTARTNYVTIPGDVLNYESITVAAWFKIPTDITGWARSIEIYKSDATYITVMPYAPNYYNGLHINTKIDGTFIPGIGGGDNMLSEGGDPNAAINTPKAAYVLPEYDAWVHYAYQLTPTAFNLYQNGKLVKSLAGNFTASQFYGENAKIVLGATLISYLSDGDMKGSIADFRVYSSALTEAQIAEEYAFHYTDFLTTSYDFENGTADAVRGYNGTLTGTASIAEEEGDNVLVIDGGATNPEDFTTRSGMTIPSKTIHGHNNVTIAMDLYVDSATGGWARIFDFAAVWNAHWTVAAKWGSSTNVAMKYTNNNDHNDQFFTGEFVFDKWVHFALTIEGQTAKLYIDGQVIATSSDFEYKNSLFWEGTSAMQFGRTIHHNDQSLIGKMDNIKIFSTALTEKEVMIEAGLITILDDAQAVASEKEKLSVNYENGRAKIDLPAYAGEGVKLAWASSNEDVITTTGNVLIPKFDTEVTLTATLTRGDATATKEFKIKVEAVEVKNPSILFDTALEDVKFEGNSYYEGLMETNLNYIMSLDKERLLYNYRRLAGLDTKGAQSYGAWISPTSGGAGQFEAHSIIALAKASRTMPDYRYNGESVLDRLTYMVNELEKVQDAYAALKPDDAGYLGAISADHFHAIEEGRTTTDDGANIWVPWYHAHKTAEMLLDVYNYAADETLQAKAWDMLMDFADWASNMTSGRSDEDRLMILRMEYGGMAEVFYQIYDITGEAKHFNVAKFFVEEALLNNVYQNKDVLSGLHSNTAIPKFLGAAAAYEVTGDEYYKTVCVNAFEMIMTRTYANGGTSRGEHWQAAGELLTSNESCETCCSYNMIKLADYLYRWTGEKKYADYIDKVYTNHILASMAPDSGYKTYLTNSAFGYYKVYHTAENSFWCCACTGLESFAKLPQNIYYTADSVVKVNMFYPTQFKVNDSLTLVQSGNFYTDQKTVITVNGAGSFTLSIRIPDWAEKGYTLTVNGEEVTVQEVGGYAEITRDWADSDRVEFGVPFTFRLDILKGSDRTYALMYGPLLLVADLGTDDVFDVQGTQLTFGSPYTGNITNKIVLNGTLEEATTVETDSEDNIYVTVSTINQGDLLFRPFNQLFHSRYGMYFDYYATLEEIDKDYAVKGNEWLVQFDSQADLDELREYGSTGSKSSVQDGKLVTLPSGENKIMADLALATPYVVELSIAPYEANGQINGGVYLFASNVAKDQDQIKAYNVQIEKEAGANTYRISVFKFNSGFLGSIASVTRVMSDTGVVDLHILVTEEKVFIYVDGSRNLALEFTVDSSFITETTADVGIRSQFSLMKMDNFKIISAQFIEVGTQSIENAIANAQTVNVNDYTPSTATILTQALDAALAVMANDEKTQAAVNEADAALRAAIAQLVKRGNPAALRNAIASVAALNEDDYKAASWSALQAAVANVNGADLDVLSEAEIAALEEGLKNALFALTVEYSDKAQLNALIATAEGLNEEDYTEESWQVFAGVLAEVKALGNLTAAEEEAACIQLLQAQVSLVAKEATPSDPSDKPAQTGGCRSVVFTGAGSAMALLGLAAVAFVRRKKN